VTAPTPQPPYVAVVFTSVASGDAEGYTAMAEAMDAMVADQDGYLGHASARADGLGHSYDSRFGWLGRFLTAVV